MIPIKFFANEKLSENTKTDENKELTNEPHSTQMLLT